MKNLFATVAALAACLTASAKAEIINCTEITSIPAVITAQGIYCLKHDLSSSLTAGNIIEIQTNNVTIDLNGFKLGGLGAGVNTGAFGIVAFNRHNITIRNGSIRGFVVGVHLIGGSSSGHLVEDVLLDGNRAVGINVEGSGHVVRHNRIVNTGDGSAPNAFGIGVSGGRNVVVADNIITGTSETDSAKGILMSNSTLVEVRNNSIFDTKSATTRFGIEAVNGTDITVIGNRILNAAGTGFVGIAATLDTSGLLMCIDNTVAGFATALSGCDVDSGNVTP